MTGCERGEEWGQCRITHDLGGKARGAIAFVIGGVCVVIGKVKVRWDVECDLGTEAEKGQLVEVGAKVLFRFEKITALEVVTGNVNVGSLPTINVGQMEGGVVEKFQLPKGANSSA